MSTKTAAACSAFAVFALPIFLGIAFFAWTFGPFVRMSRFYSDYVASMNGNPEALLADASVFSPDRFAEGQIRFTYVDLLLGQYRAAAATGPSPLLLDAVQKFQAYADEHPFRYNYFLELAKAYDEEAELSKDQSFFAKAETAYKHALEIAPGRQDTLYAYATHLSNTGREEAAAALMRKLFMEDSRLDETSYYLGFLLAREGEPHYDEALRYLENSLAHTGNMSPSRAVTRSVYEVFFAYYYRQKDPAHLRTVAERLSLLEPEQEKNLGAIVLYIDAHHAVPPVAIAGLGD